MKRISSRMTFFQKRVFPVFWFGFLLIFVVAGARAASKTSAGPTMLIVPAFMGLFGYFLFRKLIFDLADEVLDDGDSLVVRFGNQEDRIPLSEIINVSCSIMTNPQRATLTLRNPGHFGRQIAFAPPQRLFPFMNNPVIDDLIERIDTARRK